MGNVIVWLEDKPQTIQNIVSEAAAKGFVVNTFSKPMQVADFLKESVERRKPPAGSEGALAYEEVERRDIVGIVVDIMLFGVEDLLDLDITNADTEGGFEAGWVFVDRYLRDRVRGADYANIPVLVLSIRQTDAAHTELCNEIRKRGGAPLDDIQKFQVDTFWRFRRWLDSLPKNAGTASAS